MSRNDVHLMVKTTLKKSTDFEPKASDLRETRGMAKFKAVGLINNRRFHYYSPLSEIGWVKYVDDNRVLGFNVATKGTWDRQSRNYDRYDFARTKQFVSFVSFS
jgi:hypothetical protein